MKLKTRARMTGVALLHFPLERLSADARELCGLLCPDYEKFYWNSPVLRARGAEVFGF